MVLGFHDDSGELTGQLNMKQVGLLYRSIEALGLDTVSIKGKCSPDEYKHLVKMRMLIYKKKTLAISV